MKKCIHHAKQWYKRTLALALAVLLLALPLSPAAMALGGSPFLDVQLDSWYCEAVAYVYKAGLFSGTSNDWFQPSLTMTRGMFVQVLANMAKVDRSDYTQQHFADVHPGDWYAGAVEWAATSGIVLGTSPFTFQPKSQVTREQIATLLYRFAKATGNDASLGNVTAEFSDYGDVSSYAQEAVDWAVSWGVLRGDGQRLRPRGYATRAEAAQIFYNIRNLFPNKDVISKPGEIPTPNELELLLYGMSLEEKVGQLFLPKYPGDASAPALTRQYAPAGYVFFGRDFQDKTRAQVQDMTDQCQDASKIPLLMGVDEEGGTVVRVSSNPNLAPYPFDSPQNIYQQEGLSGLLADTQAKSQLLLDLGLNLNLAPVCDVSTDPDDFIYQRSLGLPAEDSAEIIAAMVGAMEEAGISGSLKHFPGYGNNKDTHTGISIDGRPYEQFVREDFLPFQAGVGAGAPSVMVSHNIINCMDSSRPASLSKAVHDVLRNELGFEGVIMSDDLAMDAVKLYTGGQSPAVEAFRAGNDLLLTGDWVSDYNALLDAARTGAVPVKDIEVSVMRVLKWKQSKGLL